MAEDGIGVDHGTLYHLVQATLWNASKDSGSKYFPPTYEADGFTHLTKDPNLLLGVANLFYKQVEGLFLVLAIDSTKLSNKVVFEAAAPVGSMPPMGSINTQLFPHLYGHIDAAAVTSELSVDRSDDGTFTAIHF